MGEVAFNDVTGYCQGKVTARRLARYGDILRQESELANKVLVCCGCVDDCSWEWVL